MENYNTTITKMNTEIFEHDRFLFYFIITIYGGAIILSIILYRVFKLVYEGDKSENKKSKRSESNNSKKSESNKSSKKGESKNQSRSKSKSSHKSKENIKRKHEKEANRR